MITSSHKSGQWNGVKYKSWYGGSGSPSIITEIETYLGQPVARPAQPAASPKSIPAHIPQGHWSFTSLDNWAKIGMKFAIDSCMGPAAPHPDIFHPLGVDHVQIRSHPDPLFPASTPSPSSPTSRLGVASVEFGCQAGLCTDGDADPHWRNRRERQLRRSHKIFFCPAQLGSKAP